MNNRLNISSNTSAQLSLLSLSSLYAGLYLAGVTS